MPPPDTTSSNCASLASRARSSASSSGVSSPSACRRLRSAILSLMAAASAAAAAALVGSPALAPKETDFGGMGGRDMSYCCRVGSGALELRTPRHFLSSRTTWCLTVALGSSGLLLSSSSTKPWMLWRYRGTLESVASTLSLAFAIITLASVSPTCLAS